MKNIPLLICKVGLILCLNLSLLYAMEAVNPSAEDHSDPKTFKRNNNKEKYHLYKENFSAGPEIDFASLYEHIHYTFKNKEFLIDALYPLLPLTLQGEKKNFEHLEFLGDSVLGLIIRERILALFPEEPRGMHTKLYEALTCNKTLAHVYQENLNIETYLPYPGERTCEYCNIVEAIIGAIYKDNSNNDLAKPKKFVIRILDNHILREKRKEILARLSLEEDYSSFVLPNLKAVIDEALENSSIIQANSKSLLGIILGKTLQDQPEYKLSLGRNEEGLPVFMIKVVGSQIGHKIRGIGFTRDEAEQDAARKAINFLAQEERIPQKALSPYKQTYAVFIHNYCQAQGLELSSKKITLPLHFTYQARLGDTTIGTGTACSKSEAREEASRQAYEYFTSHQKIGSQELSSKNYRSLLQEWVVQNKVTNLQFTEASNQSSVKFKVEVGEDLLGEGEGFLEEAKEEAYQSVFDQLLKRQEEAHNEREARKTAAKKVYSPLVATAALSLPNVSTLPEGTQETISVTTAPSSSPGKAKVNTAQKIQTNPRKKNQQGQKKPKGTPPGGGLKNPTENKK